MSKLSRPKAAGGSAGAKVYDSTGSPCRRRCARSRRAANWFITAERDDGFLPGIGHVLRVLIVAPMDYRIGIVRAQKGMDEQNARQFINELDRVRSRRFRALFNDDWQ